MKNSLLAFILSILFINGYSQNTRDALAGNFTPPLNRENLHKAKLISDVIPDCPTHWNTIIDYVAINIMVISNGTIISEESTNDVLTEKQRRILYDADLNTEVSIKIKYKYKDTTYAIGGNERIKTMRFKAAIVPATEAEFPGGYAKAIEYVKENIVKKIATVDTSKRTPFMTATFTVDENGKINNAKIVKSSYKPELDKLLLDEIYKMPNWKPAVDADGKKVKQEFKIASVFYSGGGC